MLMKMVELSEELAVQFFEIEKILHTRPRFEPSFLSWKGNFKKFSVL